MIRVHFTAADLGRVTLAPAPNALLETATSVHRMHRWRAGLATPRPGTRRWHQDLSARFEERAGMLFDLLPRRPGGWVPDILLDSTDGELDEAVETVRRMPARELAADLSPLDPAQRSRRPVRELAEGTAGARRLLGEDLQGYFRSSLTAWWPQVQASFFADRALRAETLLRGGIDALFATLGPGWRWRPPTLCVPAPYTSEVPLEGRGLVLVPSYFTLGPHVMYRPHKPAMLIYPMQLGDRPNGFADPLGALLGHTRAAVLAALRAPASTTALADRTGISLPSASEHAAALRGAGLISTARQGTGVLHTLTPLGAALLHGEPSR